MDIFIDESLKLYYQKQPLVLIDVGSSGGVHSRWKELGTYMHAIGFEPDQRSYEELTKNVSAHPGTIHINVGLSSKKGTQELHLTRTKTDSSLLKPNRIFLDRFPKSQRFDLMGTSTISVDTLDNQLDKHGIKDADFIKLDTQGSELSILQGGERIIRNSIFGLEIEVEFVPLYEHQPLFADVDTFLHPMGFQLFDLWPVYWKRKIGKNFTNARGQMIFGDAVYLRERENFRAAIAAIQDADLQKSKVLRAISVCLAYNFFDYGLEIFDVCRTVFSIKEIDTINSKIKNIGMRKTYLFSAFPGRQKIANGLKNLSKHFHEDVPHWAIRRFE